MFPSKDAKEKINLLLASGSDLPEVFKAFKEQDPNGNGDAQHFARSGRTQAELIAPLRGGSREAQRMDAAYRIAWAGRADSDESVHRLVAALRDGGDDTRCRHVLARRGCCPLDRE